MARVRARRIQGSARALLLMLCAGLLGATEVRAQRAWERDAVCQFAMGEPGAWDGGALEGTDVLFVAGLFHMFYAGSDNGGQRSGHQLGYAWSEDGCHWNRHPLNPILTNLLPWESAGVLNPAVVHDDEGFKLWYGGWSTTSCGIGFALSPDPFLFERFSAQPSLSPDVAAGLSCVFDPVVHWDGSLYRMWYTGGRSDRFSPQELRLATSTDGFFWEDHPRNPVFPESVRAPTILRHEAEGMYEMWYGTGGISYATSMDGLTWARVGGISLAGDSADHGNPTVLLIGDTYHMWYTATRTFVAWPYIRHATSQWALPRASFVARGETLPGRLGVSGRPPFLVRFDASATRSPAEGGIEVYHWDFGNGSEGSGVEVEQAFEHGSYEVRLEVLDAAKNTGQASLLVSAELEATPLPGWNAVDVGAVSFPGAVRTEGDCWTAAEAGGFVGLNEDQFHFVYQDVEGDFLLEVEVTVPEAAARNSRLGLMARESLAPDAPMVFHQVRGGRIRAARREMAGELSRTNVLHRLGTDESVLRLRLQRRGDVLVGSFSLDDGATWIDDVPQPVPGLAASVPVGIALAGTPARLLSQWQVCEIELRDEALEVPFARGDTNGDRSLDLTDGVVVLEYLFLEQPAPTCLKTADLDDSGALDLTDAVYLLNFLFLGGAAPAVPSTSCGLDPTMDALSCDHYGACP